MQYKTLGDTGLLVSTLCFGTMTFHGGSGLFKAIGAVDQAGADELIKASVDAGINFFDTADVYSEGESEKTLGQSLKNLNIPRKDVILATKVFGRMGPGRNDVGALPRPHHGLHRRQPPTPPDRSHRPLPDARQRRHHAGRRNTGRSRHACPAGKVRYIGVSNWQSWKIAKALGISEFKNLARFDTLQAYYSIAGRDLERDLVPLLEAEKTGLLVWSPLAGGLLSGKYSRGNQKPENSRRSEFDFPFVDKERTWKILDAMEPIAKAHSCSPARISLAWLLTRPVVTPPSSSVPSASISFRTTSPPSTSH